MNPMHPKNLLKFGKRWFVYRFYDNDRMKDDTKHCPLFVIFASHYYILEVKNERIVISS